MHLPKKSGDMNIWGHSLHEFIFDLSGIYDQKYLKLSKHLNSIQFVLFLKPEIYKGCND